MAILVVVNEEEKKFFFSPVQHAFNLEGWSVQTLGKGDLIYADPPTEPMDREALPLYKAGYLLVNMYDYAPRKGWIRASEWHDFNRRIWPTVKGTQRYGQAFMNHFHDRFDSWSELYYCTDSSKAWEMIRPIAYPGILS